MDSEEKQLQADLLDFAGMLQDLANNIKTAPERFPDDLSWRLLGRILAETAAAVAIKARIYSELYPGLDLTDIQQAADYIAHEELSHIIFMAGTRRGFMAPWTVTKQ